MGHPSNLDRFSAGNAGASRLYVGVDVGSTTVKLAAIDPDEDRILWSRYERHETRQAERLAELLAALEEEFPAAKQTDIRIFITGSGAAPLAEPLGARFVQEVNAVAIAVERLHPDAGSVVELGGQDAKIIIFKDDPQTGRRDVIASMNDKCASGTGATIDKCLLKVGMSREALGTLHFDPERLHHVAAKCGVFAETDIVNLIKASVPAEEVMNSLADAIVMQNLTVLTRGNTLMPKVLLLGGPNTFLPFLEECWRLRIPEIWAERGMAFDAGGIDELIVVPKNAQYYAACGAAYFGMEEPEDVGLYRGLDGLRNFIAKGREAALGADAGPPLLAEDEDLLAFTERYKVPDFHSAHFEKGSTVRGYLGFDGGSTSSKAVLIDEEGTVLAKEYQISRGNPIQDAKEILGRIRGFVSDQGCDLEILGFGATGYAADVLDNVLNCDANIVETIAHMLSAQKEFGEDIDVICDIGGQDIKVLFLQNGQIKDFRLSNQCSAGNGMLLQAMADQFGVDVRDYADTAFRAHLSPKFSYGCAVFLDTDRVNFQKEGFTREELFAGLATVLPKNIWQYVVQLPRLAELGSKFVLQGGTQYNLAAVKAQVDYIEDRVSNAEVRVHPHCGEAGAIGAALDAKRVVEARGTSQFIGLDAAIDLEYTTRTDQTTRCTFCANECARTFIDTRTPSGEISRYVAGFSCEKGTVESKEAVQELHRERKRLKAEYPNLVDYEANLVVRHMYDGQALPEAGAETRHARPDPSFWRLKPRLRAKAATRFERSPAAAAERRQKLRIGIPRVLNIYALAPFLRAYLESLGVPSRNIVFSDETSEEMWLEGGKLGSIDPCFPSKVTLAHVHHLIHAKHARKPLDYIWFPCVTDVPTFVSHVQASASCPIVAGSPKVGYAAFVKETDLFARAGMGYVCDALNFVDQRLLREQLWEIWGRRLGITRDENDWACDQAWQAQSACDFELQRRGQEILLEAERENDVVLLMLGRPYHGDPGLNHEVLDEFQALGIKVLSVRSIPKDPSYLKRIFAEDLRAGTMADVFDVRDVWPENYSANSVQKVWAAKFAARHPNVAVLDLSSFKCGQDAPTYGIIDNIIKKSRTPYLALHDLDANKPVGSIKIRVKTFAYALDLYKERLQSEAVTRAEFEKRLADKRRDIVARHAHLIASGNAERAEQISKQLDDTYEAYLRSDDAGSDDARFEPETADRNLPHVA